MKLPKDFALISVDKSTPTLEVLKTLSKNNIQSVPVYDPEVKKFIGSIDMLDLLNVTVFLTEAKQIVDVVASKEITWNQYIAEENKVLADSTAGDIINASERNPWVDVYEGLPLRSLMDMFGKNVNLHRVCVSNPDGGIIGSISQSRVINFLADNINKFPEIANKKLSQWLAPRFRVVSVKPSDKTLSAFELMIQKKVSGVAIIDDNFKIVGALSASDLKRSLSTNVFTDLHLPIALYLEKATVDFARSAPKSEHPVICTMDSTLQDILAILDKNHVHRIFVVDKDRKPIDILSLCDIIELLNHYV